MKYRKLRGTDIKVSVIGMGTWALAGGFTWGEQDDSQSIDAVHEALDVGIKFFDTAEMYGNGKSEQVLGKALKDRRDRAVIASKVLPENLAYPDVIAACEGSLKALYTEYIDLYQIHWPNTGIPLEGTIRALETLKKQGKIRTIGVSNYGPIDLQDYLQLNQPVTNQLPYSLLWRAVEFELLDLCQEMQIGVLCYSPLAQGLLTGKFANPDAVPASRARTRFFSKDRLHTRHSENGQEKLVFSAIDRLREIARDHEMDMGILSLAWLVHQRGVTSVLAGARNRKQIITNARAGKLDLDDKILNELDLATKDLKLALGKNIDMYQSESRIH